jgi:hypothetical protein
LKVTSCSRPYRTIRVVTAFAMITITRF